MATRRPTDDDSDEEEATAIDLRGGSQAFKPTPSAPSSRTSTPPTVPAGAKKPPQPTSRTPKSLHSSEDEEATEFLSVRPPSSVASGPDSQSSPSLRARGRAVPLEGEASSPSASPARTSREDAVPAGPPPGPLPSRTPRPLPQERQTNVKSETQTGASQKSAPRITRIFQPGGEDGNTNEQIAAIDAASATDPGEDDEVTDPPLPRKAPATRPLPERADALPERPNPRPATNIVLGTPDDKRTDEKRTDENPMRRAKTSLTKQPTSETLEAEPADGTLIVEVPEGAVVFVNGLERGRGPQLKVLGIDRYAKHAVRIHAPGYAPWSGSVCLEGRTAAKIRPGLKPKK